MRTTFKLCNPDEMEATVTVTMRLKEWKELRKRVADGWPGWQFKSAIDDVILQAEKVFYAQPQEKEQEVE